MIKFLQRLWRRFDVALTVATERDQMDVADACPHPGAGACDDCLDDEVGNRAW